jgi:hypothetical protein
MDVISHDENYNDDDNQFLLYYIVHVTLKSERNNRNSDQSSGSRSNIFPHTSTGENSRCSNPSRRRRHRSRRRTRRGNDINRSRRRSDDNRGRRRSDDDRGRRRRRAYASGRRCSSARGGAGSTHRNGARSRLFDGGFACRADRRGGGGGG